MTQFVFEDTYFPDLLGVALPKLSEAAYHGHVRFFSEKILSSRRVRHFTESGLQVARGCAVGSLNGYGSVQIAMIQIHGLLGEQTIQLRLPFSPEIEMLPVHVFGATLSGDARPVLYTQDELVAFIEELQSNPSTLS